MAKRYAVVFGAVGYVIVVWYYATAFAPLKWATGLMLLWHACIPCGSNDAIGPGIPLGAVLSIGPLNALLYGAVGYVIGKGIHKAGAK